MIQDVRHGLPIEGESTCPHFSESPTTALAHYRPLFSHPFVFSNRSQSSSERFRVDLGERKRFSGLQLASAARECSNGHRPARCGLEHILGRKESHDADRRVYDGCVKKELAA